MVACQRFQRAILAITLTSVLWGTGGFTRAQDSLPFDTVLEPTTNPGEVSPKPRQAGAIHTQISATEPLAPRLTNRWIGRPADELIIELVEAGWLVVTETPSLVQLDRDHQGLDLHIDRSRGAVVEVEIMSP